MFSRRFPPSCAGRLFVHARLRCIENKMSDPVFFRRALAPTLADVAAWTARLLVAIAVTIVASQGFYAAFKGHLKTVEAATTTPRRLAD